MVTRSTPLETPEIIPPWTALHSAELDRSDCDEDLDFRLSYCVFWGNLNAQKAVWQPSPGYMQIPIWPGAAPDARPVARPEAMETTGKDSLVAGRPWVSVRDVSQPTMTIYPPKGKNTGAAVPHLATADQQLGLNPEIPVTSQTPPTFLLQNEDDHVDNVNDSLAYYIALKNAGVPVEMHLYAQGGHAFGLRRTKFPVTRWPELVETWLGTIGMIAR